MGKCVKKHIVVVQNENWTISRQSFAHAKTLVSRENEMKFRKIPLLMLNIINLLLTN